MPSTTKKQSDLSQAMLETPGIAPIKIIVSKPGGLAGQTNPQSQGGPASADTNHSDDAMQAPSSHLAGHLTQ